MRLKELKEKRSELEAELETFRIVAEVGDVRARRFMQEIEAELNQIKEQINKGGMKWKTSN